MPSFGIYTLANDAVFDQLVALLNSIEANVSAEIPVCIIPYNDNIDLVRQEIAGRSNVSIFNNPESLQRWDLFAKEVWTKHPGADKKSLGPHWDKSHLQRKFAAFDGEFEQFVFYDADSLAMKPLSAVRERLKNYDFVFDDWEHIKPAPVAALNISEIEKTGWFSEADIRPKLHCSSFFASQRGFFNPAQLSTLSKRLLCDGELKWINQRGWWDDAFWFNYMTLRCQGSIFNFTLSDNGNEKTGNCAHADSFVNQDNVLYNQDGLKPIHRIHYMNYSSQEFARLCRGEDVKIPYQEVFLHYRFLKEPHRKPTQLYPPNIWLKTRRFFLKKIQRLQGYF